jgi:hypothetical protein
MKDMKVMKIMQGVTVLQQATSFTEQAHGIARAFMSFMAGVLVIQILIDGYSP